MGFMSDIIEENCAKHEAAKLSVAITDAINTQNVEVAKYALKVLVPLYEAASESGSEKPNPQLKHDLITIIEPMGNPIIDLKK